MKAWVIEARSRSFPRWQVCRGLLNGRLYVFHKRDTAWAERRRLMAGNNDREREDLKRFRIQYRTRLIEIPEKAL